MISLQPTALSPLRMPWRHCVAVGRAYELLREDLLSHLDLLQKEIGFRSCRFHAIFHDDVGIVHRGPDGRIRYRWHQADKIYDALLARNLRPFVELNPMPKALASGDQTMFFYGMNVTPPKSYQEWYDLVRAFTAHWVERYGLDEVRQWNFEVWNEPNLSAFWSGTKEEYWKLYEASARAVKAVDEKIAIGGPASSKANWVTDIITHCTDNKIPLDFVSTHLYPQDEFVDYENRQSSPHAVGEFFADTFRRVQKEVKASVRPDLPIHWTEWNTQAATNAKTVTWGKNSYVDSLFGATFVAKNCVALDDACDTMAYWVASDIFEEGGIPHSPLSCTYGMVTIHGIPKPVFHAFRFLGKMKGARWLLSGNGPEGCGGIATHEGQVQRVLLWNHAFPEVEKPPIWEDQLEIEIEGARVLNRAKIRAGAGSIWEVWKAMGEPQNLTGLDEEILRARATPEYHCERLSGDSGKATIGFKLEPLELLYLEIKPVDATSVSNWDDPLLKVWDEGMSGKSK